jgi:hypothetical protein
MRIKASLRRISASSGCSTLTDGRPNAAKYQAPAGFPPGFLLQDGVEKKARGRQATDVRGP